MAQLLLGVAAALGRRAAEDALDARHELARVERLRQVVVGADLEADDLVDVLVAGGEHQDRHVRGLAHAAADLDPVDVGQHQVEDDQRGLLGRDLRQRGAAGGDGAHVVAGVLEVEGDERGDRRLVLDDQNRLRAGGHQPVVGRCTLFSAVTVPSWKRLLELRAAACSSPARGRCGSRLRRSSTRPGRSWPRRRGCVAAALADGREVDAASVDDDPVAAADDAEAHARAAVADTGLADEPDAASRRRRRPGLGVLGRRGRRSSTVPLASRPITPPRAVDRDFAAAALDRERAIVGARRG